MSTRLRLLVCPMNWGLGHASRSIFLVKKLIADGRFEIILAADGPAHDLLQSAFPDLPMLSFPANTIHYGKYLNTGFVLVLSLPKILMNIYREHRYLSKIVRQYHIDMVVSDNRYGAFCKNTTSIFVTHQLRIPFPGILKFLEPLGQKINYWFIRKYDFCWIPDQPGTENLAGGLSHPGKIPSNARYIGPISRFLDAAGSPPEQEKKYDIIVLLSGPEPQRTILEKKLIRKLGKRKESVLMIQGLPGIEQDHNQLENISMVTHVETDRMKFHLLQAQYIICRAGYSSIMDLAVLGRNALLIPTPGQPEQEYLASYLFSKLYFFTLPQAKLDLEPAFDWLELHHPMNLAIREERLNLAIEEAFKKNTS